MKDLEGKKDIIVLVDEFYTKVRRDDLLGPIFNEKLGNHWEQHLAKMYDFWDTILFSKGGYKGSPFEKHQSLPVEKVHFERWLALFEETMHEHFEGTVSAEAIQRATTIGWTFWSKIQYLKQDV